jgi:hypothetical protein
MSRDWYKQPPPAVTKSLLQYRPDGLPWAEFFSPLSSGECARALITGYHKRLGCFTPVAHIIQPAGGGAWVYFYAPGSLASD